MNASVFPEKSFPGGSIPFPDGLVRCLALVPDPRLARTRKHALCDILLSATCALLCGYDSYPDMADFCAANLDWLRRYVPLAGGVPSHDTYRRVLGLVSPAHFGTALVLWVRSAAAEAAAGQVALDGKALRRATDAGEPVPYIVNAWSAKAHLVLGQVKVMDKENEIVAIPRLLQLLDLRGALVSIDAIGCQTRIAAAIRRKGADYLLALKDNQPLARQELETFMQDAIARGAPHVRSAHTVDKGHGRLEERTGWVSRELDWFEDRRKWSGLACVVMVESRRTVRGKTGATERRMYLCSRAMSPAEALEAVRMHWGVECLHWVLDIVMDEDHSRARTASAAENLALIRRLAYNLLQRERDATPPDRPPPRFMELIHRAARDDTFRSHLLDLSLPGPEASRA